MEHVKFNLKLLSSYQEPKSVILSFTTHDEVSPVILHGENFSNMISWLEATLPFNPYCIDGFFSGDTYIYTWANTKAFYSDTDDNSYFVHRGKLDIFNFSRKPGGNNENILKNFKKAYEFRKNNAQLIAKGSFLQLKTKNEKVFAFERSLGNETIIVIGNLDYENLQNKITVKVNNIKKDTDFEIINGNQNIKAGKNKIFTDLDKGEIKVIKIKEREIKHAG